MMSRSMTEELSGKSWSLTFKTMSTLAYLYLITSHAMFLFILPCSVSLRYRAAKSSNLALSDNAPKYAPFCVFCFKNWGKIFIFSKFGNKLFNKSEEFSKVQGGQIFGSLTIFTAAALQLPGRGSIFSLGHGDSH